MKAIRFDASIPRYALGLALGKRLPSVLWNGASCTFSAELAPPELPAPDWVLIRTRYGGICGTDIGSIHLHTSPYYSPLTSFPFTFGHENLGRIVRLGSSVKGWELEERVVAEPLLWCRPRGFANLCRFCAVGETNRCLRPTEGVIGPGLLIGGCRDTGGSWSEFFVAHESQLFRVPDNISDENSLLVEPFAVGLHAALQNWPEDTDTVLLLGAGIIGLCTLAALRALGSQARILVLARYGFQAEAAKKLGATQVLSAASGVDTLSEVAECTGARVLKPILGKRIVIGGADLTFECVGSDSSVDDALRLTRNGGRVVLVGVPGIAKGVDWTAIFAQELVVRAAYAYHHAEPWENRRWTTFELAFELLSHRGLDLGWLVTHRFRLDKYAAALDLLTRRGPNKVLKAVFEFDASSG